MDAMPFIDGSGTPSWPGMTCQRSSAGARLDASDRAAVCGFSVRVGLAKGRILVVDDDVAVREILSELLDLAGFVTVQAENAEHALVLLRQDPAIAALVTDLTMPGQDGIALIRLARALRTEIPAILLTGYAEEVTSVSTIAGGNFHVLRKPVESDRLIARLDLLLAPNPGG